MLVVWFFFFTPLLFLSPSLSLSHSLFFFNCHFTEIQVALYIRSNTTGYLIKSSNLSSTMDLLNNEKNFLLFNSRRIFIVHRVWIKWKLISDSDCLMFIRSFVSFFTIFLIYPFVYFIYVYLSGKKYAHTLPSITFPQNNQLKSPRANFISFVVH